MAPGLAGAGAGLPHVLRQKGSGGSMRASGSGLPDPDARINRNPAPGLRFVPVWRPAAPPPPPRTPGAPAEPPQNSRKNPLSGPYAPAAAPRAGHFAHFGHEHRPRRSIGRSVTRVA